MLSHSRERLVFFFFFQAEDGIRDVAVTGVQTCALPICQIVARVLLTQGVPATILDHSVEMLEVAHTFGYRVFFGDATRMDLLRIAGADKARVLVIAVDSSEQSLKIAEIGRASCRERV